MSKKPKYGPVPPGLMLQYLVVLAGTDPLVWRRILVPATYTFWDLHVALQDAMGWLDYHLHEFRAVDPRSGTSMLIGLPDPDGFDERPVTPDWTEFPLDYASGSPSPIQYRYDFGDDWRHAAIFEGFERVDRRRKKPRCIAGGGACPPEDCGGPRGYADFLAAIADSEHPEHEATLAWVGGAFDPSTFDAAAVRFDDPKKRFAIAFEGGAI